MAAGLTLGNVGVRTTDFYPRTVPMGGIDLSAGNVSQGGVAKSGAEISMQPQGALPALWWLGILIVLVAIRVLHEYS